VKGTLASDMICPSCTMPLAPSGHLTVLNLDGSPFVPLPPESYKGDPNASVWDEDELEREWDARLAPVNPPTLDPVPSKLSNRDRKILRMRKEGKTNAQIGKVFKISPGRVSQIYGKIKDKGELNAT